MVKLKKTSRTTSKKKPKKKAVIKHEKVGVVKHFFTNIKVAINKLDKTLNHGDKIRIQSGTPFGLTNFNQTVKSIKHDHKPLKRALPGREIGLKVRNRVRQNDVIYKKK